MLDEHGAPVETETPATPPVETKPDETTPSAPEDKPNSDKSVPFHEDPKVQDYINRQVETRLNKGLEQYKPVLDKFKTEDKAEIPYWFNGDEKQWKDFDSHLSGVSDRKAKEAVEAYKAEQEQYSKRVQDANQWFELSVTDIEKDGGKVDRNKLLKFVMDKRLVDDQGRWNYKAGYEWMDALEKAKNDPSEQLEIRKEIANKTGPDNKPETKKSDVKDNKYFKTHRPW